MTADRREATDKKGESGTEAQKKYDEEYKDWMNEKRTLREIMKEITERRLKEAEDAPTFYCWTCERRHSLPDRTNHIDHRTTLRGGEKK